MSISEEALENIDVMVKYKNGSVGLSIITTGELVIDDETMRRLSEKMNNYLYFINSDEFIEENGEPDPSRVKIIIEFVKDPSEEILDIIEQLKPQAESWNASLTWAVGKKTHLK